MTSGESFGERCYAGLDLGTSSLKGIVVDRSGAVIAQARSPYETTRPAPGAAEQTARDWIAALRWVVSTLIRTSWPATIGAVGLSGMMPTLVTLDGNGEPTGPAITWEDRRAEGYGPASSDPAARLRIYETTGQWVDGRYLVPMFLRLLEEEPERAAASSTLCSAKDYLFFHLTGELVTDPSTASGSGCFDITDGRYSGALVEAATERAGRALPRLPPVVPATCARQILPEVASDLGLGAVDVCVGAADSIMGALGVGALGVGAAGGDAREPLARRAEAGACRSIAYLSGTSTVMISALERFDPLAPHRLLVTPALGEDRYALEADLLSTGSSIAWLSQLAGEATSASGAVERASACDPSDAPVFLPYLAGGEQGALWDETVAGTVLGLRLHDDAARLMRGLLTGIVLESRRCIDAVGSAGTPPSEILASGELLEAAGFRRDLADATGVAVTTRTRNGVGASVLGAAVLAGASDGFDIPVARSGDVTSAPNPERADLWAQLWARHEEARTAVSALYRKWNPATGARAATTGSRSRPAG